MTTETQPTLTDILASLRIETHHLTEVEIEAVYQAVQKLSTRMTCESWAAENGVEIPPYGTREWGDLEDNWLECN